MSDEEKNKKNELQGEEEDISYESEEADSEIGKLKKKLSDCRKEKEEYLSGWQRAQADFINYRRRQEEQMGDWIKAAGEKTIRDLLPFLDSLQAAVAAHPEDEGLETLKNQLSGILKNAGLEEIKSIGEKFNPNLHEVVECEGCEAGNDLITAEMQKGYLLNGKVIRAAKVKIKK